MHVGFIMILVKATTINEEMLLYGTAGFSESLTVDILRCSFTAAAQDVMVGEDCCGARRYGDLLFSAERYAEPPCHLHAFILPAPQHCQAFSNELVPMLF